MLYLFIIPSICVTSLLAWCYFDNRLPLWHASLLWKQKPFNSAEFKKGNTKMHSEMVVDIVKSKMFLGKTREAIREQLGSPTGAYYVTEANHTYKLSDKKRAWTLTLYVGDAGVVEHVYIRRNNSITRELFFDLADVAYDLSN